MQGIHESVSDTDTWEIRWQVTTAKGRRLVCTVCVTGKTILVRLTSSDELVCADCVASLDAATALTRRWLHAVLSTEDAATAPAGMTAIH